MALSQVERDILLHMTGLDRSPDVTRNHFAADPDSDDFLTLDDLAHRGYVTRMRSDSRLFPGLIFFKATDQGLAAAREAIPA